MQFCITTFFLNVMFSFMLFSQLAIRDQKIKDTENRIETEVSITKEQMPP